MTRNLIDFTDIETAEFYKLFSLSSEMMKRPGKFAGSLKGKVVAHLFYEPSTRTNLSFQTAALRLGGSVIGFSDPGFSSVAKGESLKDTISVVSRYADAIVIRNPLEGAALAASLYSRVPVINAGDGGHLHPTQTLADLATIKRELGRLSGFNIGVCGDLKNGRTVHSLIKALSRFPDIKFYLISPRGLSIPDYVRRFLEEHRHIYLEVASLEATIGHLDVLYMTRIQKERFGSEAEYARYRGAYILTRSKLSSARENMLVLHPLPRVDEITPDTDGDPRAKFYDQAENGMYMRMALLHTMLKRKPSPPPPAEPGPARCKNPHCVTAAEAYLPPLERRAGDETVCEYCDRVIQ